MFLFSPRKFQVNKFIDFIDDDIYNLFKFGYFSLLNNMTQHQACFYHIHGLNSLTVFSEPLHTFYK